VRLLKVRGAGACRWLYVESAFRRTAVT